jgi:hypothetical protein
MFRHANSDEQKIVITDLTRKKKKEKKPAQTHFDKHVVH